MAELPPITPEDLAAITAGATACDHLAELSATRTKMQTLIAWLYNDAGEIQGFKTWLLEQLLADDGVADPDTNGWHLRTNPTTGKIELVEKTALTELEDGTTDGDTLRWDSTALGTSPDVGAWVSWHPFVSPVAALPAATVGGRIEATHSLGYTPTQFSAQLVCIAADQSHDIGDLVDVSGLIFYNSNTGEVQQCAAPGASATKVWCVFRNGTADGHYQLPDKASWGRGNIDVSKWQVRLIAQ